MVLDIRTEKKTKQFNSLQQRETKTVENFTEEKKNPTGIRNCNREKQKRSKFYSRKIQTRFKTLQWRKLKGIRLTAE